MQLSIFLFLLAALVGVPLVLTQHVPLADPHDATLHDDVQSGTFRADWHSAWTEALFFALLALGLVVLWQVAGWLCAGLGLPA